MKPAKLRDKLWRNAGVAVVIAVALSSCGKEKPPVPAAPAVFGSKDALVMCQVALKRASRDPETAVIPDVPDMGGSEEYYFAWSGSTKMARMRNGLGLEVATSAFCSMNKVSKEMAVTIDGKVVN